MTYTKQKNQARRLLSPRAARLRDILQLRFTPLFVGLPARTLDAISPANPLKRLAKVIGYTLLRLVGHVFQPIRNREVLHQAVWLYVVSQNNVDALRFIRTARADARLIAGQGKNIGRYASEVNRLSLRRKILYYWQLPSIYWGLWRTSSGAAWRFFDLIFAAIGYYEVYRRALRHYQPRAVIFANDHNDDSRALLLACQAEDIPTAYVQHASVSHWFPPLAFDLNLLEGQHALDTYLECGPITGVVELVGMPKADAFIRQRNQAPRVTRVAIAANLLDPTDAVVTTINTLLSELPTLAFTFRPHPSDTRNFRALLSHHAAERLGFSDARQENIFEYLQQHDALVAADTSTHLEATLLNLASLYYRFNPASDELLTDYYGFVRHGVAEAVITVELLVARLRELSLAKAPDIYQRAAYYCATLGTAAEGQSEALALRKLSVWLQEKQ